MGVRPEYIDISPDLKKTEGYLADVDIRFVEPQGSHSILIANVGETEIKIHTSKYMDIKAGSRASLNVKEGRVMFFDCDNGKRVK